MLEYNRTITRTNINVLLNIGPGEREEGKKKYKKVAFPTLMTMIVAIARPLQENSQPKRAYYCSLTIHFSNKSIKTGSRLTLLL